MVINFENLKYTDKYTDKWKKFECLCAYRQLDSLFLDSGIFEYRIELLAKKNISSFTVFFRPAFYWSSKSNSGGG